MIKIIFATIVAPLIVGITLRLFDYWLDNHHNDR